MFKVAEPFLYVFYYQGRISDPTQICLGPYNTQMYMHTHGKPITIHIYIPVRTSMRTHTNTHARPYRASMYTTINSVTIHSLLIKKAV